MYNPKERLYKFVPCGNRRVVNTIPCVSTSKETAPKVRKNAVKAKKTVFVHTVNIDHLYTEFEQTDRTKTIRQLCEVLESRKHIVLLGEGQTPEFAATSAAKFGTGNLLLYAVLHGYNDMPQYLALGKTAGCRVEGKKMYGTLNILTAFGGHDNPYTQNAVEHDYRTFTENQHSSYLHWDILPRRPLWKLLKQGFIKPYISKFTQVYSELKASNDVREVIVRLPLDARSVLLLRKLFTSSEEAEKAFVQTFDS